MDSNTIMMLCVAGYGLVAIIIFILGASFEDKVIGDCNGNIFEKESRQMTYTLNIALGGTLWPISIFVAAIIYLIEFLKEKINK